jgi:photosystem II stability/assembly factor-like uncharacterized protein
VRTVDGGRSWQDITPPSDEKLTFRDVEAFDRNCALVLAAGVGTASRIYRTTDGGASWDEVFRNYDAAAFYNGLAFFDQRHGIALSDPVGGRFRILTTTNGGCDWTVSPTDGIPPALPGEGARATGTCLVARGPGHAWFGTQPPGPESRIFRTQDRGRTWTAVAAPIPGGLQFGIASLTFWDLEHGLALGGGCPEEPDTPSVVAETANGGKTWVQVAPPSGFRTSIAAVQTKTRRTAVTVGLNGSDMTTDGGHTWKRFDHHDLRGVDCLESKAVRRPNLASELDEPEHNLKASCWAVGKSGVAAELEQRSLRHARGICGILEHWVAGL